ncbi:MAG TPA: acyl-CoA dehydrogenase family protein [Paracoccaceae bacterium]|nr:acyl-CoA dehydrogenase family protein [Paracoccaceae bacterium]
MRFPLSPDEEAFRTEVQQFCAERLPRDLATKVFAGADLERADYVGWQRILAAGGLLCGAWPEAHGGRGWSPLQAYLFDEACSLAGAPWLLPFGVNYVGPVLYTFGSEEQKARYLPGIRSAATFWCQGYSEPEAGSDLAGLKTRALREGDHYRVTGRKIWTTMAHWADRMFCLVRTRADGRPQAGISFLLIDMKAPGVTVRPIVTLEGRHHLNEVILEDVRVPLEDRVGEENAGWTIAKYLLGHERLLVAEIGKQKRILGLLREELGTLCDGGRPLAADRGVQERLAELEIRLAALEWTALRTIREAATGELSAAAVSMLKIRGSELEQALTECAIELLGPLGLAYDPALAPGPDDPAPARRNGVVARLLAARATTIYGGSNEVQRNIIAKSLIAL